MSAHLSHQYSSGFFLVMSNNISYELTKINKCPTQQVSSSHLTRFIDSHTLYSFINFRKFPNCILTAKLEGNKAWVKCWGNGQRNNFKFQFQTRETAMLAPFTISLFEIFLSNLLHFNKSLNLYVNNGFKILPLKFSHTSTSSSVIYNAFIKSEQCDRGKFK